MADSVVLVESEKNLLNVGMVLPRTEAEGPGVRYALWVQGCPMRCAGCCNPEFLQDVPRSLRRPEELAEEALSANVEGVSLLGGEPFAQPEGLAVLASLVQAKGLTVMIYTGFTLAELRSMQAQRPAIGTLLEHTDLLVDGRYEQAQRTEKRRWIGSENQVLHFLTSRYSPDDPRFSEPNTFEVRISNGKVVVNGWPVLGAKRLVRKDS